METLAAYVNDEEIAGDVAYMGETETDTEKRERLGIIGDSLEITNLEDEIDKELIKKIKVSDTEERIKRLKEVLALLKGYRMSSDIKDDNTTESEQKSEEKEENEVDREEKKEDNDDVKLDKKEKEDEVKNGSEYVNPDLKPKRDGKGENAKQDVVDDKKTEQNSPEKKENEVDRKDNDDVKLDKKEKEDEVKNGSEYVNPDLKPKRDGKGENAKQDVVDDKKTEQNSPEKKENEVDRKDNDDVKLDKKEKEDEVKNGSEYVNPDLQQKNDGKGEERKEDVVEENKKEGKSETDDMKSEEVVESEEISKKDYEKDKSEDLKSDIEGLEGNKQDEVHLEERSQIEGINDENISKRDDGKEKIQTESSISQSLDEIFVNTPEEIEEIKKHVRFNLEHEEIEMDEIEHNGSDFSVQITVGEIVNKLFVVQDSEKKHEKIDDDYVNFPSSQANAESFFDEMKQKEEHTYKVETEDISEPESEDTENMEKSMDLIPQEQKSGKDNNDVENVKESEEVQEKEGSEENDTKKNNEESVVDKDTQEDEEGKLSSDEMEDDIRKKDMIKDVFKREEESENEGSDNSRNGENGQDGLIFVER